MATSEVTINKHERDTIHHHATWELQQHAEVLTGSIDSGKRTEAELLRDIAGLLDAIGWDAHAPADSFQISPEHRGHVEIFRATQAECLEDDERMAQRPITADDLLEGQTVDEHRAYLANLIASDREKVAALDAVLGRLEPEGVAA